MNVSVVLCTHNGAATIGEQLAALARQDYDGKWELVLVDDGSTDRTVEIAESWSGHLPLRVVPTTDSGAAVGLANARNVGGNAARGDVLLFCDDDDVADDGWITAFADAARECPALGGHNEEESLNDPVVQEWRYPNTPGRLPIAFGVRSTPLGNNCAVWRSVFHDVGGFDPVWDTFRAGEEFDFFLRLQQAGHEVRYVPDAIMHIRHRNSLRALRRQWYAYGRGTAALFARFEEELGLRRTSVRQTLAVLVRLVRAVPKAIFSRARRGAWLRMTSFALGQAVGSVRAGVWHVG
jgi:glycosyltransferase involved in cell wall biosynthesis